MKVLIAGLGSIGRRHLKNLGALGIDDIILYRTRKGTLEDAGEGLPVFTDLESALGDKPDAVIISNPTALHMPIAAAAARANVHIFLEKPISHSMDSLREFELALQESASRVFVAYQFRFNPGLRTIKNAIEKGAFGSPISFNCRWGEYLPDWHPWEDYRQSYAARPELGGGVVLTLSHPIDYLRWFFGDVSELSAVTGNRSGLGLTCEDFADVQFKFKNGVQGILHLDYDSKPKVHDLAIACEEGTLTWDYSTNGATLSRNDSEEIEVSPPIGFERNQMYIDEMAHFIKICEGKQEPLCTYGDGKKTLDVALGILQSGRYNDRVLFEK